MDAYRSGGPEQRGRAARWLRRYAPAEAAGLVGAVTAAGIADRLGSAAAATALAGALGETIVFYAVMLVRDLRGWPAGSRRSGRAILATLRGLMLEFGPAEVLDTVLIRPAAMYLGPILVGSLSAGVITGKIAADLVFYTLAIIGYEVSQARVAPAHLG